MTAKPVHVLLISDDRGLRDRVESRRPPRATVHSVGSRDVQAGDWRSADQIWVDLDSVPREAVPAEGCRVYFYSAEQLPGEGLPAGLFIRKPCSPMALEVLWARVESCVPPRTSSCTLPVWLLDFLDLDIKSLCRRLVTDLAPRLGYRDASLYLHDREHAVLSLAGTTHSRSIDLAVPIGANSEHLMASVADSGGMLQTDCVSDELVTRDLRRSGERPYPDEGCLVAPLESDGRLWGVLNFSGRAGTTSTEDGLPLEAVFLFLGRALHHARVHEQARLEARVDGLTGLYNQRWMTEALEREIRRAERFSSPLAVLMIDLDGLKAINDRQGHAAGDRVLRHVASQITRVLRQFDGAARVGGDEFVVMLPGTTLAGARGVARRVLRAIRKNTPQFRNAPLHVAASIGAAEWRPGWEVVELLDAADQAMYRSKQNGRGAGGPRNWRPSEGGASSWLGSQSSNTSRSLPTFVGETRQNSRRTPPATPPTDGRSKG